MPAFFALKLEPLPIADWEDATAGVSHDPLWFVARQWQLGELQGENASTPVRAVVQTTSRVIAHTQSTASLEDVPAEVLVESEINDWWTIGRRLRVGATIAASLGLTEATAEPEWLIADPPPPYDLVAPAWDGLVLWRSGLAIDPAILPEIPPEIAPAWVADRLVYERDHEFDAEGVALDLRRHRGGRLDWYSVDARDEPLPPVGVPETHMPVVPARVEYPGMPRTGVWEIESPESDIGAMAPDAVHSATAIMTALFFSHRDEWFDIPVNARAGRTLRVASIEVVDSFGESFHGVAEPRPGPDEPVSHAGLVHPTELVSTPTGPMEWGVFRTANLPPGELLLWQAVDRPLVGDVVESVQFGVDDESNVVWAVERRIDQRDTHGGVPTHDASTSILPPPPSDRTRGQSYHYVPAMGATPHWIPYTMPGDGRPRTLEQRLLPDLSVYPIRRLPTPRAHLLQGQARQLGEAVVPLGGMEVQRRWMLARDACGKPHLWIQRERKALFSPPARRLRFDIAMPTDDTTN
jgi:hypothetical protein